MGLDKLSFLAGRCAILHNLWSQPDKAEMKALAKRHQRFTSSHDYEGKTDEKLTSSIVEWSKKVPPGSPGSQDIQPCRL